MNEPISLFFHPKLLTCGLSSSNAGEVEVSAVSGPYRLHGVGGWVEEDCSVVLLKGKPHHYESLEKQVETETPRKNYEKGGFPWFKCCWYDFFTHTSHF